MITRARMWVVFVGLLLLGLIIGSPAPAQQSVKVAYIPISSAIPFFAAQDRGYFAQAGLKLQTVPMAGGAVIIPALIGGSLDIGGTAAFVSVFAAREKGMDIVIVAPGPREAGLPWPLVSVLVREDSGINTPKDLEGKTFAVNVIKSVDWVTTSEWMTLNGADPKKVNWVEIPFPVMGKALIAKKVDAMTGVDPFTTLTLGQGGVKSIGHPFAAIDPKLPVSGWIAIGSWIKKNRSVVDHFSQALQRGIDFVNANPERRGETLAKFTRVKPALAAKLRFYPGFDKQIDARALQKTVDLAVKWGLIEKRLDVKDMALPGVLR
jgi:NitT/TauT family transport system substrate-binding protein